MKTRINNTFNKLFKSNALSSIFTTIIYCPLYLSYYLLRWIMRGKTTLDVDSARTNLEDISPKPQMDYTTTNQPINIDLSIIVPAYNSENTIKKCTESVIGQETSYDYELIIVNDGSTDNTRSIIEEYNDKHLLLVNQDNRGFSGARNRGIDESSGKYIMFLDSDDYLIGNCIELMMNNIINNNADITQASFVFDYENASGISKYILNDQVEENNQRKMVSNPGYPWAKIYKRELFNNIRFPLNVWFEDTIVSILLYRICKRFSVMSNIAYGYRINPEGITQKARNSNKCIDHYWVMEHCLDKANELSLPNDNLQYEIVKKHMSTLLYRRIGKMDNKTKESAFVLAADVLDKIRPKDYQCNGNRIEKDLETAFINKNYKLWKVASFLV